MKVNKLLVAIMAAFTLFSCAKENGAGTDPGGSGKMAYMSITLTEGNATKSTKADSGPVGGGSGQGNVNDVNIMYFDQDDKFVGQSGKLDVSKFTKNGESYKTAVALQVPSLTKKAFVIVNNYRDDGTTQRFVLPTQGNVGHTWETINAKLSEYVDQATNNEKGGHDVNAHIERYTGQLNGKDNFIMVNFGVRMKSENPNYDDPTHYNDKDNGLVAVSISDNPTTAPDNIITIDRVAAKVQFVKATTVTVQPAGASFTFQGWEMSATNRFIKLYAEHEHLYKGKNDNNVFVAYRKDPNYLIASYGTVSNWTEYKKQFTYLRNIGTDEIGPVPAATSVVNRPADVNDARGTAYAPENTMEAYAQLIGGTTKVVVKGNYVPSTTIGANASYFTYAGVYYTLAGIQNAYKDAYDANQTGGIVEDLKGFLIAAHLAVGTESAARMATLVAGLTASSFDENTGIIARLNNAVRYFHKGVSYYDVLIRHDARITDKMKLGRYGVVRNNWYVLTLNSVSGPGTPWIPGGPDDPTSPPETPDDNEGNLAVTITINPWVKWSQGVDL